MTSSPVTKKQILTDLDDDGDLDLLAPWTTAGATGWAMALNDGHGAFQTARTEETEFELLSPRAGDVTGDGHDEIVIYLDKKIEIWSIGEEYQIEVLTQIPARYPLYLADWDGDGDSELFAAEILSYRFGRAHLGDLGCKRRSVAHRRGTHHPCNPCARAARRRYRRWSPRRVLEPNTKPGNHPVCEALRRRD